MDQAHASGIGEWDPNSFVNEQWDHPYGGAPLGFDSNHAHHTPDNGFHTPDTFIGTSAQINPQLSATDNQQGLYREFDFYQQPQNDVWPGQVPSGGAYGQEGSLPQGFFAGQQPSADTGRTVDSRFALVDGYQEHHVPVQENQEALQHGFRHIAHAPNPTPDTFLHRNVAGHWGQRVPTSSPGYVPSREYESPLAAPQATNLQNQGARGAPSPFTSAPHGPVPGPVPPYQVNPHPQIENRQPQHQPQYVQAINGQPIQNRASIAQHPVARNSASPHVISQPVPQNTTVVPPLPPHSQPQHIQPQLQPQQPSPQPQPQPKEQLRPQPHLQLAPQQAVNHFHVQQQQLPPVQPQDVQQSVQSVPSPEKNSTAGVKRRPVSEIQEPKLSVKKTKVSSPQASNTGSPSATHSQPENTSVSQIVVDEQLLEEGRGRVGGTWPGVPNLVVGDTPVKLKKGTPTKRYVVISTKGGKDPLFPDLAHGWTPAESLGNHADAYQSAKSDLDRQRADIRLEIEMDRGQNDIPSEWWKKVPRGDSATDAKRIDPPPEPTYTVIEAAESLRIHPAHKSNRQLLVRVADEYYELVLDKATKLKNSPVLDKLAKISRNKIKNPATFNATEFEALKQDLVPLRTQLECAIVEGLKEADPRVLRRIGDKNNLPVRLLNLLINLINIGDANSPLAKAILRLFGGFTGLKPSTLEMWKFPSTRIKLETQGDSEVKDLVAVIFSNAEKNADKDFEMKTSKETGPGGEVKRPAKSATRVPSGSLGAKRAREDDNNGDSRSSKKAATESKPSAAGPMAMGNGKMSSVPAKSTTIKAPSAKTLGMGPSSTTATSQPKVRTGLLLPGKTRPVVKAPVKPEPIKTEASKTSLKQEPLVQPQPTVTKVEAPKPTTSKSQSVASSSGADSAKPAKPKVSDAPQPSRFASLLAEIDQPKKVMAPTPPPISTPDPNETEEEKARRLRKEERRRLGLKVTFRGEDRLVEVREFARHPDEIEFTNSAVGEFKSEGKNKSEEGMALKKSHAGEIHLWDEPLGVDFSVIPQEQRDKTFVTRGGVKEFRTESQKFTEDREGRELMVIYTDPSDIPPTPKSPSYEPVIIDYDDPSDGMTLPETPAYAEIRQRAVDQEQQGPKWAFQAARARLETRSSADYADFTEALKSVSNIAQNYNGYPTAIDTSPITPATAVARQQPQAPVIVEPALLALRDQQVYDILMSDRVKAFKDLDPYDPSRPKTVRRRDYLDPMLQRVADYIEDMIEHILRGSGSAVPKLEPAQPVAAAAPQAAAQDLSSVWAQYYAQQAQQGQPPQASQWYSQQQQQSSAYPQAANPYGQAQPANPQQTPDLSAIMSALGGQQAQQAQQASATPDPAQFQALFAALGHSAGGTGMLEPERLLEVLKYAQQGGNSNPQVAASPSYGGSYPYTHPDREREVRERDRDVDNSDNSNNRDRDNSNNNRDHHHRSSNRGKNKNRNRGGGDQNRDRDGDGNGDVPEHLRGINRNLIGTKQCTFWVRGQCAKGSKCTFRHD